MTFKEDWNNWSKGDKLGNIIYSVLILTLCGGIVYLFGFKDHLIIISDLLQKNLGEFIGVIYFLILGVGIMVCGG